jgi:fucose permease
MNASKSPIQQNIPLQIITPVMLSFFVMSFCDLVGIGVDNAKADFNLTNTMANMIPLAVFVWFFILSVPIGILQDHIGKKNMVNIGMLVTAMGLILPFLFYSYPVLLMGFVLLGIGNTIIQVSANPLLIDVVTGEKSASFLSFAQFIKAVGSMVAPYIATWFAMQYGDWKLTFLAFGIVSIITTAWLHFSPIREQESKTERASIGSVLSLLKEPYVVIMVLCIFFVVGIDVGINATSGQFLMKKLGMDLGPASQGRSLYFFGKMLGTFAGGLFLSKVDSGKVLLYSTMATSLTILLFIWSPSVFFALSTMFLMGLAASVIFPMVFAILAGKFTTRTNEISGLVIMAVCGGAFIPPIVGKVSDIGGITTGMFVFFICALYMIFSAFYALKNKSV